MRRIYPVLTLAAGMMLSGIVARAQVANESSDKLKSIAVRYLNEAINGRKLELVPELFAEDCAFHGMDGNTTYGGKDGSRLTFLKSLLNAFPDLHYSIDVILAEGDKVAMYCSAAGTHRNDFLGVPASGNKVSYKESFIYRIANGQIVESWSIVNVGGVIDQMKKKD